MRVFPTVAIGCALTFGGWTHSALGDPFKIYSGKMVDIVAVKVAKTPKGQTLKLQYRSRTPLSNTAALRKEADGLWQHFFVNAERGGHKRAVISALGPRKAGADKPVDFIFVKRNGNWRTLEKGLGSKRKLTKAFMEKFIDRLRVPLLNDYQNAALLYMARDWRGTLSDPKFGAYAPKSFDRTGYLRNLSAGMAQVSDYASQYEILSIRITGGGTAALIESRDTGSMTLKGYRVTIRTRSVDHFQLRGGAMVWTKSDGTVEDRQVAR